jgi:hypothetical protein
MAIDGKVLAWRRRHLARENTRYPRDAFVELPTAQLPEALRGKVVRVLRSREFLVQVYEEANGILRLSICRTELDRSGMFRDGITWDQLQRLKALCGYSDRDAVEVYPPDADLVNKANMRHLWVLNPGNQLTIAWRANDDLARRPRTGLAAEALLGIQ